MDTHCRREMVFRGLFHCCSRDHLASELEWGSGGQGSAGPEGSQQPSGTICPCRWTSLYTPCILTIPSIFFFPVSTVFPCVLCIPHL